jgi:hypothetical protein
MNRSTSIAAASKAPSKENLARRYLQLQRLRHLVQEAERLIEHAGHEHRSSGINPDSRHSA